MPSDRDYEILTSDAPPGYESYEVWPLASAPSSERHCAIPPPYQATGSASQHSTASQADWRPPKLENLDCLDTIVEKIWKVSTDAFRTPMIEIYLFARWHRNNTEQSPDICIHWTAFGNYLRRAHPTISDCQSFEASHELERLFRNPKLAASDPFAFKLREQLDHTWENMPKLMKWQWLREWQGVELDAWEYLESSDGEFQLIKKYIAPRWKNPAKRNLNYRTCYGVVAQMYLAGKLWPVEYLFKADPAIESLCEYMNKGFGSRIFRPSDVKVTWYQLHCAYSDPAAMKAKALFRKRMDTLWSKMSDEERNNWKKVWRESEAAAQKREEREEKARKTKIKIKEVGRLLALDWTSDLDEKYGRAS